MTYFPSFKKTPKIWNALGRKFLICTCSFLKPLGSVFLQQSFQSSGAVIIPEQWTDKRAPAATQLDGLLSAYKSVVTLIHLPSKALLDKRLWAHLKLNYVPLLQCSKHWKCSQNCRANVCYHTHEKLTHPQQNRENLAVCSNLQYKWRLGISSGTCFAEISTE